MPSINSPVRRFLKPILFKLFGKSLYPWFQFKAKVKDIEQRLVEESEMELLPLLLDKEGEAVDIGANYAYYTVPMARLCKKVYAFEPIPFTHKVCEKIVKHFRLKNVILFKKGVGEKNEWHQFNVPVMSFGGISAGQSHFSERDKGLDSSEVQTGYARMEKVDCEVVALDSFLNEFANVQFIKIDIEGAEYFALKGMLKTIDRFKPAILVEINPLFLKGFGISEEQLKELIAVMGYKTYVYDKEKKKLLAWTKPYIESNYIILPASQTTRFQNLIANEA